MKENRIRHPEGFNFGYTPITKIGETHNDMGIDFGILRLKAGQTYEIKSGMEQAYLLMTGEVEFEYTTLRSTAIRNSIFDEDPWALHMSSSDSGAVHAVTDAEIAVSSVSNENEFESKIFCPDSMLESEKRGKGLLGDAAFRIVRTIFDIRNRPEARLVLGEVITLPGRWSSYPPHHHSQPEIYHYRFTKPQGFGHGELGEDVLKVRQYDTVKIPGGCDHAQTAAPGYGMYYIWVIRHLPGDAYTVPEFTEEHRWAMEKGAKFWTVDD